jgi:hypothetical protein
MPGVIPLALVFLLSLAQFFSDRINIERSKYKEYFVSFAASIAITYLLFSLLPEAYGSSSGAVLFIPLILGFVLIHLIEKIFYRKYAPRYSLNKVKTYHDELHAAILFVYHFVIGVVLIKILDADLVSGLLFLLPLLLFTTIGNLSVHHAYLKESPYRRLALASSTLLGALFSTSALVTPTLEHILFNFTAGILLFIVVRESLPQPKEGKSTVFVAGVVFYALVILALNSY